MRIERFERQVPRLRNQQYDLDVTEWFFHLERVAMQRNHVRACQWGNGAGVGLADRQASQSQRSMTSKSYVFHIHITDSAIYMTTL